MGLECFVVVKPESPGFSGALQHGKTLAANGESLLVDVARQLRVRPLVDFFSTDPHLAALELEEGVREGAIPPEALLQAPAEEQWFSPDEGLQVARALLSHVEAHADVGPLHARPALAELVAVLEDAQRRALEWHFELF